jgi:hypothetical protein
VLFSKTFQIEGRSGAGQKIIKSQWNFPTDLLVGLNSPEGTAPMNPPDEFLKHAAECEQMAKFVRDPASKATWNRMADRWRRCAEKFTTDSLAARHAMPAKRRQGVAPAWAHH